MSYRTLILYALPSAVFSLPTIPIYIYLPSLYGDKLGLGLAVTGLVLFAARIFDTIIDPIVGYFTDTLAIKGMRRKPWVLLGSIIAGIGLFNLLSPPMNVTATYLFFWLVILYGGWTMIIIPYTAWGVDLSSDYFERTLISACREGLGLAGIIIASILGVFAGLGYFGAISEIQIILISAMLMGLLFIPIMLILVPDHISKVELDKSFRNMFLISKYFKSLFTNKLFLRLVFIWFLNGIANGVPAALLLLYLDHALFVAEDMKSIFLMIYFIAAIFGVPIWVTLSKRIGKHKAWCFAMVVSCIAFSFVPLIEDGAVIFFMCICFITGLGLGADLTLPPAIQADIVDYDQLNTGHFRPGQLFSLWAMATKLALAVSVGIALPLAEGFGFDPSQPSDDGRLALVVIYSFFPVVVKTIVIIAMWSFPLNSNQHALIRRKLDG